MENQTKFHVTVGIYGDHGGRIGGARHTIYAEDRETAKAEAVKSRIRSAKAYNAKYHESFVAGGVEWALQGESPDNYRVEKIRKAPVRK